METDTLPSRTSLLLVFGLAGSILLLIADYFAGPFIQFPISYLIPVAFLSWSNGRRWGLILAILMPLVRFYFNVALWSVPWTLTDASINALIRIVVLSSFALLIDRTAIQTRKLSRQVSAFEGLLPICSHCKKIRDQNNQWQIVERYIAERSAATFSHGICPECLKEHYGDLIDRK
jgi:K+-sensing histidine kinase KdpD